MEEVSVDKFRNERWRDLRRLTDGKSVLAHPAFEAGIQNLEAVQNCHVLVIGAGGLGCELLKDLSLLCCDISFISSETDIGKSKAEVAAIFIQKRIPDCPVIAHNCKIQDKDDQFYRSFDIIICGLDSIVARRWLNAKLVSLVEFDSDGNPTGIIPLIDGGTEGFKGNSRVILPTMTACIECTITFPMCTIANTPRLPEHCIEYVKVIQWDTDKPFSDEALDADNMEHVEWVFNTASKRAEKYNIKGVDLRLTQGVLKRIIPAVASTNAVIAASCALEALKLASNISCPMQNYLNFTNIDGVFMGLDCLVCGEQAQYVDIPAKKTLRYLLDEIIKIVNISDQLCNPSVQTAKEKLYMRSDLIPELDQISTANLSRTLKDKFYLISNRLFVNLGLANGDELLIADETQARPISLRIRYQGD
ncbi:NEDD8-activating enzyme E1 catalytic subunit [Dirofilaria immitis]|nr:NEDD8-activating enzyme E1 catalytic subunit [Dirofilaria immitis]